MSLSVGKRACLAQVDTDRRGTVRYVGHLDDVNSNGRRGKKHTLKPCHFLRLKLNAVGLWAGVEWDEPREGLHDGIMNGKRLFTAK